jgi:myosin protein heavy chain
MPSGPQRYEGGLHADSEAGPIDVGLAVTPDAMGLTIDAPLIGQLWAAFSVLRDGTTRLTALSRRTTEGIETPITGLTDESGLARLHAQLDTRESDLTALDAKSRALEAALEAEQKLAAELAASLEVSQAREQQLELRRSETQAAREELQRQLDHTRRELEAATTQLTQLAKDHAAQTETAAKILAERDETRRRLALSEETRHADTDRFVTELGHADAQAAASAATAQQLSEKLSTAQQRATALELELGQVRTTSEQRGAELEEERRQRDELVRDLAYIQSQVADLATTKGALVSRVTQMTKRETQRQKSTAEFSDLLRTAEVVAADVKTTARRHEGRALQLEAQLKGLEEVIAGLQAQLATAAQTSQQLQEVTAERDALKIDVTFFQKQIGALQRAKQQPRPARPATAPEGEED